MGGLPALRRTDDDLLARSTFVDDLSLLVQPQHIGLQGVGAACPVVRHIGCATGFHLLRGGCGQSVIGYVFSCAAKPLETGREFVLHAALECCQTGEVIVVVVGLDVRIHQIVARKLPAVFA